MASSTQRRAADRQRKLDRQQQLATLRLAGIRNQTALAARFGVAQSTISRDFAELDRQFADRAREDVAAARGLDLERLDDLLTALWTEAKRGNWHAVDRALKVMERRAALLGLDSAKKVDLTGDVIVRRYVGVDVEAV